MVPDYQPKQRGRPKDLERRARIVASAMQLFLEHGMQAVSIESIAEHAQVSNRTVYSHFAGKPELLWAVIVHAGESIRPIVPSNAPSNLPELRNELIRFGIELVSLISSPTIVNLGKLMISESNRHPELAKQFFEWGPRRGQIQMEAYLELAKEQELISSDSSTQIAHHLLAMLQGTWHMRQQLGLSQPMTKAKIRQHVIECVDFFLKGVQRSK
jgi:TetR/AcrR family transcriptional repressor of mexJK operon